MTCKWIFLKRKFSYNEINFLKKNTLCVCVSLSVWLSVYCRLSFQGSKILSHFMVAALPVRTCNNPFPQDISEYRDISSIGNCLLLVNSKWKTLLEIGELQLSPPNLKSVLNRPYLSLNFLLFSDCTQPQVWTQAQIWVVSIDLFLLSKSCFSYNWVYLMFPPLSFDHRNIEINNIDKLSLYARLFIGEQLGYRLHG